MQKYLVTHKLCKGVKAYFIMWADHRKGRAGYHQNLLFYKIFCCGARTKLNWGFSYWARTKSKKDSKIKPANVPACGRGVSGSIGDAITCLVVLTMQVLA